MARARNIKPSFFTNDKLADCALGARLLFIGLWTIADREGRLDDNPRKIKAVIFPYDNMDCDNLLIQLEKNGFILRYSIGENKYIQILNFVKHQNPHIKEGVSSIPAPDLHCASTVQNVPLPPSPILNPDIPKKISKKVTLDNLSADIFSPEEKKQLLEKYPNLNLALLVEKMKDWCLANGKYYKDYKAAIRNWASREQKDVKHVQKSTGVMDIRDIMKMEAN